MTTAPSSRTWTFTSESVTEGHPDKVCDYVADSILDAYLEQDPRSRVACEALVKDDTIVVAGEITSRGEVDRESVIRQAVADVGYDDPGAVFSARSARVIQIVSRQAPEIARAVDAVEQGAGDQGQMYGYASDETVELMPLPIQLAHRITHGLAEDRKNGRVEWLASDGKAQVSVRYEGETPAAVSTVVVSAQHARDVGAERVREYVTGTLLPRVLGRWLTTDVEIHCNPAGSFVMGGPAADCGVTGRKTNVDTYGGMARHGGGALSGKDPSKVDRSAAYFCRWVARQIVSQGMAHRVEVQVAYAIGVARPVALLVDTFGTGDVAAAEDLVLRQDFRPAAIIERLDLQRPLYRRTTNYGHVGKPGLPWEM